MNLRHDSVGNPAEGAVAIVMVERACLCTAAWRGMCDKKIFESVPVVISPGAGGAGSGICNNRSRSDFRKSAGTCPSRGKQ